MDRLATLCELADSGSFSKASKGDINTASLMSRQIRELESFFGIELVRRRGRGVELTDAGLELAIIGRENFKGIADFAARCQKKEWTVRMVASNSVAQWLLLPRMESVIKHFPEVRFEIHHQQTRQIVSMTREGAYDLAFVRQDALLPTMESASLGEVRHALFIPKSLCKSAPKSAAKALATLPMALPIGGKRRENIDQLAASAGGSPKVAVACSSYMQVAQLVQSGICAGVLPETAALSKKVVHRLPLDDKYTLCLAWTTRNSATRPRLVELISVLREILQIVGCLRG